jgi:hypothetical protein
MVMLVDLAICPQLGVVIIARSVTDVASIASECMNRTLKDLPGGL